MNNNIVLHVSPGKADGLLVIITTNSDQGDFFCLPLPRRNGIPAAKGDHFE